MTTTVKAKIFWMHIAPSPEGMHRYVVKFHTKLMENTKIGMAYSFVKMTLV